MQQNCGNTYKFSSIIYKRHKFIIDKLPKILYNHL